MTADRIFSRRELAALVDDRRSGRPLLCPRCEVALEARPVPPRSEVAYVRSRVWWVCPKCRRSAIMEDPSFRQERTGE